MPDVIWVAMYQQPNLKKKKMLLDAIGKVLEFLMFVSPIVGFWIGWRQTSASKAGRIVIGILITIFLVTFLGCTVSLIVARHGMIPTQG